MTFSRLTVAAFSLLLLTGPAWAQDSDEPQDKQPGINSELVSALRFRNIGPAFMSGRIGDIAVDPYDRSVWYVVAASGGVWKTTNSGVTFQRLLHFFFEQFWLFADQAVGVIIAKIGWVITARPWVV